MIGITANQIFFLKIIPAGRDEGLLSKIVICIMYMR